jgi:MFS family permease
MARLRVPPLLRRDQPFRSFWIGQSVSALGDQVTLIALPLTAVLALDAGAAQMGYLAAAALLPNLFFSLHLGSWIDRRGRRREAMIAADLGRAALLLTVPVSYALGTLTFAQLYAVAFLGGVFSVVFFVSHSALFVSMVPRERYVDGNSLLYVSRAFSFVAGPSLGGILVQIVTAPVTLLIDALSFLGSAICMGRISPREPRTSEDGAGVAAGVAFIRRSPVMRSALGASATINFFNFAFWAIFILFATRELGVGPGLLGAVLGAGALGGVIGALLTKRLERRLGIGPLVVLGCVLFPAPLVLVGLATGPLPAVLGFLFAAEFLSGIGVMVLDISLGAIFAAAIPDPLRARVSGAYMVVNYGVRPIGSLCGGLAGSLIGLRPTLLIASICAVSGVLWLLPSPLPRMRSLPQPV